MPTISEPVRQPSSLPPAMCPDRCMAEIVQDLACAGVAVSLPTVLSVATDRGVAPALVAEIARRYVKPTASASLRR